MRTLLLASLALSSLPSFDADACGPYGASIRMHLLTSHGDQTFAVLHKASPENVTWKRVAPRSYDHTRIAAAPALDRAIRLTLVGPDGARIVESRAHWFLDAAWGFDGVRSAMAVETGKREFRVALVGDHQDAKWIPLSGGFHSPKQQRWLKEHGFTATQYSVGFVGDVETFSIAPTADQPVRTVIRRDNALLGHALGRAIGAVSVAGLTYILVEHDGAVRAIDVY